MVAKQEQAQGRREALLQAAAEIFFEQGYAATRIDSIIERAGGSKRNIYSEFGNKEGLFTAIVARSADKALAMLSLEDVRGRDLRQTLTAFGRDLMYVYMSPSVINIFRIVITEANRFPDLVKSFYEQGPGRTAARLAEVLESEQARGTIRSVDCGLAASHFVGMIRDNLHLQVVLGIRPPPTHDEVQQTVDAAVDVFLSGIRRGRD